MTSFDFKICWNLICNITFKGKLRCTAIAFSLKTVRTEGDGTMVTARQYDGDTTTVRWWHYDSTMVTVRQYDGLSPLYCRSSPSSCRTVTIVLSYCHHRTVMLRVFVLRGNAMALTVHRRKWHSFIYDLVKLTMNCDISWNMCIYVFNYKFIISKEHFNTKIV